mmetsp:Transcript_37672/g.57408  ORF Transcript_37672/g.57408 Transcript_37672/m.57408 type:complete len:196 (-) Transcript_37672:262-849(-)
MAFSTKALLSFLLLSSTNAFVAFVPSSSSSLKVASPPLLSSYEGDYEQAPTTFRESEVLGLRLMQEGRTEEALQVFQQGMRLPGSRPDVVRTKTLSGPSPVGGSFGGLEGNWVFSLDEFETQAAHYNIACAFARLGNVQESVNNLQLAFQAGFDNYATVRVDPDLQGISGTPEFEDMMSQYERKFPNPFGLFGKK